MQTNEFVKQKYGDAAQRVASGQSNFCCGASVLLEGGALRPMEVRHSAELWVGCIAGARRDDEYTSKLQSAGFENVQIEPTRVYDLDDQRASPANQGIDVEAIAPELAGKVMGAFIRAVKPAAFCRGGCCS